MLIDKASLISGLLDYLFILVFCLIGAIVKDNYNTFIDKDTKVNVTRILISTLVSSILLFSLSDFILDKLTWKLFILPCFAGGMIGFELMGRITKLSFWIDIISKKGVIDKVLEEENKNKDSG